MRAFFTRHALERYEERIGKRISPNTIDETGHTIIPKIEYDILKKGMFKRDPREGHGFYCVVNNLAVYRGFKNEDGNLIINTCYSYTKKLGNYLKTLKTIKW